MERAEPEASREVARGGGGRAVRAQGEQLHDAAGRYLRHADEPKPHRLHGPSTQPAPRLACVITLAHSVYRTPRGQVQYCTPRLRYSEYEYSVPVLYSSTIIVLYSSTRVPPSVQRPALAASISTPHARWSVELVSD